MMANVTPLRTAGEVVRIPLDLIQESVVLLRSEYDEKSLEELGESQESEGTLQPIIVAKTEDDFYELIIGSRRLRSARLRGAADILALVIESRSPLNYLLMALAENLHRKDLNPFEEAQAFLRLMKEYDLGVQEIAQKLRKSETFVRRRLELLAIPEEVKTLISEGKLGLHYVDSLARVPDGGDQVRYALAAVKNRLTVEEMRELVRREMEEPRFERKSRQLTVEKARIRLSMFTQWLRRISRRLEVGKLNSEEKEPLLQALKNAELEIRSVRAVIYGVDTNAPPTLPTPARGLRISSRDFTADPEYHGEVWTVKDLNRICANGRPSDEELARELGRTVGAIRNQRSLMRRKPVKK